MSFPRLPVRILFAVVLSSACAVAAHAQDNIGRAYGAFQTCSQLYPDRLATIDALKSDGWNYEGNLGGTFNLFSTNGRRAFVATRAGSAKSQGCLMVVSGLKVNQAFQLADAYLRNKQDVRRLTDAEAKAEEPEAAAMWTFSHKGETLGLAVMKPMRTRMMRGSGLVMGQMD